MTETFTKHPTPINLMVLALGFAIALNWVVPWLGLADPLGSGVSLASWLFSGMLAVGLTFWGLPLFLWVGDAFLLFVQSPVSRRRWRKFTRLKRGYWSFLLIVALYLLSFASEFLINNKAIFVKYQGKINFTLFSFTRAKDFGMVGYGLPNFRALKALYESRNRDRAERIRQGKSTEEDLKHQREWGDDWVLLPIYPYGPLESLLNELPGRPPHAPTIFPSLWRQNFWDQGWYERPSGSATHQIKPALDKQPEEDSYKTMALAGELPLNPDSRPPGFFEHPLGTDDRGRDVLARMVYGFRTSLSFAILVTFICYIVGITVGALLGYYGGRFDILMQRLVEVWSAMPFLYTVMIVAAIMAPDFWLLALILCLFGWMSMTYFIRGEFLREKSKDYVSAAIAIGCSDATIIFRHILPNALTPVISFAPFAIVGNIGALVSLDFLGFGLPPPTPSWGELMAQGLANLSKPWLVLSPMMGLFLTLLLVSFIGEAIREAFDPKEYSRLR